MVFALLVVAAWFDWRNRKIPNLLTMPMMAAGLLFQFAGGTGWLAFTGIAGGFLLTLVPVGLKGMGMGDQKLLMAVGAWSGWSEVYSVFLLSILLCLASVVLVPRSWMRLHVNLNLMLVGWAAHRQLWIPALQKSAVSFSYAVWLLAAYVLHSMWSSMEMRL
ncbi:A24 family peptidase [Brevibacillus panacihumi]|uniref:A24 family peptidase n=1 Tax=Brevibacillus panacihumi TaxID=497735 RepID=UPI003CFCE5DC